MPHYTSAWFILAAALMLPVPTAHAVPLIFTANLSGANELPIPVPSPGTRSAIVMLDPTAQTLQINAVFSGLTSNVTMAHIHCCAPRHQRRRRHRRPYGSRVSLQRRSTFATGHDATKVYKMSYKMQGADQAKYFRPRLELNRPPWMECPLSAKKRTWDRFAWRPRIGGRAD